jgi:heme/copper-type cytochrome/quinol oxidase subunit 1
MLLLLWNIFLSLRSGAPAGDDPWEGNTLEWATTSPPPPYNFDRLPEIRSERPLFDLRHGRTHPAAALPVPTEPSATSRSGRAGGTGKQP